MYCLEQGSYRYLRMFLKCSACYDCYVKVLSREYKHAWKCFKRWDHGNTEKDWTSGKKRIFLTGDIFLEGTSMARIKLYHSASREMWLIRYPYFSCTDLCLSSLNRIQSSNNKSYKRNYSSQNTFWFPITEISPPSKSPGRGRFNPIFSA